jgi:hypothetical protein
LEGEAAGLSGRLIPAIFTIPPQKRQQKTIDSSGTTRDYSKMSPSLIDGTGEEVFVWLSIAEPLL